MGHPFWLRVRTFVAALFLGPRLRTRINFSDRPSERGGKKRNFHRGDFRNSIYTVQKYKFGTFLDFGPFCTNFLRVLPCKNHTNSVNGPISRSKLQTPEHDQQLFFKTQWIPLVHTKPSTEADF